MRTSVRWEMHTLESDRDIRAAIHSSEPSCHGDAAWAEAEQQGDHPPVKRKESALNSNYGNEVRPIKINSWCLLRLLGLLDLGLIKIITVTRAQLVTRILPRVCKAEQDNIFC